MKNKQIRKYPKRNIVFKAPYKIHEIIDKWVEENEEGRGVLLRKALKLGLIEMGLLTLEQPSEIDNETF